MSSASIRAPSTSIETIFTASGFITTDNANNQITGFYPGAMNHAGERSLRDVAGAEPSWRSSRAGLATAMQRYPAECRELGMPYIYDLGMSPADLSDEESGRRADRRARC